MFNIKNGSITLKKDLGNLWIYKIKLNKHKDNLNNGNKNKFLLKKIYKVYKKNLGILSSKI